MLNSENHFVIKHFFVGQYLWLDFVFCPKKKNLELFEVTQQPNFYGFADFFFCRISVLYRRLSAFILLLGLQIKSCLLIY